MLQVAKETASGMAAREAFEGDRTLRARIVMGILVFVLIGAAFFSLFWGASDVPTFNVLLAWIGFSGGEAIRPTDYLIVETIRLPRILMGMLIGAALAVSGAVMQGLFRNPLADPGIVGVSAGAALGAISVIVLGPTVLGWFVVLTGFFAMPIAAFIGAVTVTFILYAIATRQGRTSVATMLLAGIAIGAFAMAITGILTFVADDLQLRQLTFWGLGSLAGGTWTKIASAGPIIVIALAATPFLARSLNALALGEGAALHMGIPVQRMKNIAILSVSAATGAAVAISGGIGFVGIVVPHILRLAIGPDHRYLLPCSALLGATFLILADCVARTIVAPAELPIGIVTAAVGAPFFLWILLRKRGIVDL